MNRSTFTASMKREWIAAYEEQAPLSMRHIIKMKDITHKDGTLVTVSVGVTSVIPTTLDEALYKAKQSGRNQVVVANINKPE